MVRPPAHLSIALQQSEEGDDKSQAPDGVKGAPRYYFLVPLQTLKKIKFKKIFPAVKPHESD